MPRLKIEQMLTVLAVASLPLFWLLLVWFKFAAGRSGQAWVISGHRGRLKADNAGALYDHMVERSGQPCVWIGDPGSCTAATRRHSWRARLAIARAPVLIYSHGEDDLDLCMAACRGLTGMRVYLGHGANVVKRGIMHPDRLNSVSLPRRLLTRLLATDYDVLLCQSDLEKTFWDANAPEKEARHVVCGGARLDKLVRLAEHTPDPVIIWFPTFRDTVEGQKELIETIKAVAGHQKLFHALEASGRRLHIVVHINNSGYFTRDAIFSRICVNDRIAIIDSAQLAGELARAEVLVTDYSSVLADWLLFDRPAVFFPFDLARFEAERGFHMPYENYLYGPTVTTADELVATIATSGWQDRASDSARRAHLRRQLLGDVASDNSVRCVAAIRDWLANQTTKHEREHS